MGTGLAAMAWITTLSLVLHSLSYLQAQDICCKTKIVSGTLAEDQGLAGTYTLIRDAGVAPDQACANGCVYSRDGVEGDEYCFQAVAAGADIEDQECGADTGATEPAGATDGATEPAGGQNTASSDELRQQALDAAERVDENNNRIAEANQNIENAESTTEAIDDIQEKLSPAATTPSRRVRQKRQDTTDGPTPMPVEVPATCNDFGDAYKKLLDLAADVKDDNIDQIKVYVDALIVVDVEALCDSDARAALATETNALADAAIESTKEYTDATEVKVTELKQKVNEDIALQETINEDLVSRDEPTVPVAASTHAIEPTTPSAEEETPEGGPATEGETPEGSAPVEGETPEGTEPVEGETPEGTGPPEGETPEGTGPPEGTEPAEGETFEGTAPVEGETPEGTGPAEGETTDGTPPMQISTAKPARLLFERKRRSRGSLL